MMCFGLKDRKKVKTNHCVIVLLDDTQLVHELHASSTGQDLLDVVIKHLNLIETSYFGLKYLDSSSAKHNDAGKKHHHARHSQRPMEQIWLDVDKSAIKQLRDVQPMTVYFGVKYYASDPCKLAEEITRYQFFLQCKQDILHSRLPITFDLAIELFALAVQSELGDFDPQRHHEGYVSEFQFLLNQTADLERRVALFHRNLTGQVPATAELNFLERVKWLDLYGCELHPIQYEDNSEEYALGLNPSGVLVLRNKLKVAHYLWPRIEKTKSQGRCFLMDVIDNKASGGRNRFGFRLIDKMASSRLRQAVEEHKSFFTLVNNSATLNQLAHRQQQQMKFSQRFRNSIRSAINVGPFGGFQQQHADELHQQRLRSSMKSLSNQHQMAVMQQQQQQVAAAAAAHYALDSRPPPTVVRMPSRRYGNKSMNLAANPYCSLTGTGNSAAANGLNANGLPQLACATANKPANGSLTMVDSQRQQAMLLMNQFNQMNGMIGKSQTLKPMPASGKLDSKEAKKNPYYQQMMMMAMMAQNGGRQDVSIVPPGRHLVQPSIYKASSVVNGINQLGVGGAASSMSKEQAEALAQRGAMMQFFNTQPQYPGFRSSGGHESPRSTKSAIGPSSAMKLACKKLAKQQLQLQQQQQLLYDNQASLAYDVNHHQPQRSVVYPNVAPPAEYYGVSGGYTGIGSTSANTSPRSMRSNRLMSRHKSKSTNENLNLLHNNAASKYVHPQANNKMLLATTTQLMQHPQMLHHQAGQMGPPPPGYRNGTSRQASKQHRHLGSDNESDASKMSKHSAMVSNSNGKKRATFALDSDQANTLLNASCLGLDGHGKQQIRGPSDLDEDYCCSRSDCSSIVGANDDGSPQAGKNSASGGAHQPANNGQRRRRLSANSQQPTRVIDDQQEWNAIRRRHNEFLLNGVFSHQQQAQDSPLAGSDNGSRSRRQQQQLEPRDEYDDDPNNNSSGGSQLVKNIANKQATPILLSMNYDQGNANNKAIQLLNLQRQQLNSQSSSSDGTKSTSSVVDSANSSVASSPQAPQSGQQQPSALKGKTTDSTSSTTSGYYAGSNSTGSASIDSDSQTAALEHGNSRHLNQANSGNGAKHSKLSGNRYQPAAKGNYHPGYSSDWHEEGSRAKIALGAHGARLAQQTGNRSQFNSSGSPQSINHHYKNNSTSTAATTTTTTDSSSRQLMSTKSQKHQQQFYLTDSGNNNNEDCHQTNQSLPPVQPDEINPPQWSPLNQIQQHAPSSLKYVSFDV